MGEQRLTPEELAEIARKQDIVSKLLASGAFDIRGGSVVMHFDALGALRLVERHDTILRT